jgi:hypothetical protein
MARQGWAGNIETSNFTFPSLPFTIACWFNPADLTGNYLPVGIFDGTNRVEIRVTVTTGVVTLNLHDGSGDVVLATAGAISAGSYSHLLGVFNGSGTTVTSGDIWVNGTQTAGSGVSRTFVSGTSKFMVGGGEGFFTCRGPIDYPAGWTSALTSGNVASLQNTLPHYVASPYFDCPLLGADPEVDNGSGAHNINFPSPLSGVSNFTAYTGPALGTGSSGVGKMLQHYRQMGD